MSTSDKSPSRKRSWALPIILATSLLLAGCNNTRRIDGVEYDVYGLADQQEKQNPEIEYRISPGSVIVAVIFSETVIIPLYVLLYDLYEPVQKMPAIKGQIS